MRRVFQKSKNIRSRVFVIVFFVLLPSWDVIFSFVMLPAAMIGWSNQIIYKQIRVNSLFFEGDKCGYLHRRHETNYNRTVDVAECAYVGLANSNLIFSEENVFKEGYPSRFNFLPKAISFRCVKCNEAGKNYGKQPCTIVCSETSSIESEYSIAHSVFNVLSLEFDEVSISNRLTGEYVALCRVVRFQDYANFIYLPFFGWAGWEKKLYSGHSYIFKYPSMDIDKFVSEALSQI